MDATKQKSVFHTFYDLADKNTQDTYLGSLMTSQIPKERVTNPKRIARPFNWTYEVKILHEKYSVCKNFFSKVFSISYKRSRVIQSKLRIDTHSPLITNKRGKHNIRPNKIDANVWMMVEQHWAMLPHKTTHYCLNSTSRNYFNNPELNVRILFYLFCDHFKKETGNVVKMKYATYHRYFRENSIFSFRKPRSDICDFCAKCEILLNEDPEHSCKTAYKLHRKKVDAYRSFKESIIKKARKDESVMALEFDYGQKLPLPKLDITRQFYKRLMNERI